MIGRSSLFVASDREKLPEAIFVLKPALEVFSEETLKGCRILCAGGVATLKRCVDGPQPKLVLFRRFQQHSLASIPRKFLPLSQPAESTFGLFVRSSGGHLSGSTDRSWRVRFARLGAFALVPSALFLSGCGNTLYLVQVTQNIGKSRSLTQMGMHLVNDLAKSIGADRVCYFLPTGKLSSAASSKGQW